MDNTFKLKASARLAFAVSMLVASSGMAENMLEEVVVTATKRAESLSDVPVSVAALGANELRDAGITDIAEVTAYIPNFEVSDASILPNLYIRGIGSGTTHSIEQSVGRFIDEIYIGRAAINLHPFLDVASVEVLRGPQGTLFGKNTLAGAMIIHTSNPTDEFEMGIDASASAYSTDGGQTELSGFVSGALGDGVRGRLAGIWRDKDGYIENQTPGPDGGTREDYGIRAKLEFDIGDKAVLGLKLEHMEYEEEGQTPSETVSSNGDPSADGAFTAVQPDFSFGRRWESWIDCSYDQGNGLGTFCPDRDQDSQNLTAKLDYEIDNLGTFTSITGFQQYEYLHRFVAIDQGIVGGSLRAVRDESFDGFSQEFRLTSNETDTFDYIVGLYYEDSELVRDQFDDFNVPEFVGGGPAFTGIEDWEQDTETIALFGQLRFQFGDSWSAILGGRYSEEEKDYELVAASTMLGGDPYAVEPELEYVDSRDESEFTPSFTLRWETTDELMTYFSVAKGHKTGGFSDRPGTAIAAVERGEEPDLSFDPEFNVTYELGMKYATGSLEVNAAIFYMDIEDLQVARALPGETTEFEVRNAAEATSEGIEIDGRWLLTDALTLGFSYAYTDASYDDFPGANTSCPDAGGSFDPASGLCNYKGIPLIYAPEHKGGLWLQYEQGGVIGDWGVNARVAANYSDEYYPEINYIETLKQDSFTTVDASIRLSSEDERYSVALIGKNLTEEYVVAWGLQAGFTEYIAPNAPRELSLQFSYRY